MPCSCAASSVGAPTRDARRARAGLRSFRRSGGSTDVSADGGNGFSGALHVGQRTNASGARNARQRTNTSASTVSSHHPTPSTTNTPVIHENPRRSRRPGRATPAGGGVSRGTPDAAPARRTRARRRDDRRARRESLVAPARPLRELVVEGRQGREQPLPGRGVEGRQVAFGVEEQPVVDDLDVEGGGVVDEARHHVGGEQVERVALVSLGAVQREVAVEVALEAEPLAAPEAHRQVARAEQAVVADGIQDDMRQGGVEPQRDVAPLVRRLVLARAGLIAVVADFDEAGRPSPQQVVRLAVVSEVEDHAGQRGVRESRMPRHPVRAGEAVQAVTADPGGAE